MKPDKPPRQSIKTLIRKAIRARYNLTPRISESGEVWADFLKLGVIADWSTSRTHAGSVCLRHRGDLFFRFGPDA